MKVRELVKVLKNTRLEFEGKVYPVHRFALFINNDNDIEQVTLLVDDLLKKDENSKYLDMNVLYSTFIHKSWRWYDPGLTFEIYVE